MIQDGTQGRGSTPFDGGRPRLAVRFFRFFQTHMFLASVLMAVLGTAVVLLLYYLGEMLSAGHFSGELFVNQIIGTMVLTLPFAALEGYPIVLTLIQGYFLGRELMGKPEKHTREMLFDGITILLALVYVPTYMVLVRSVELNADWQLQLYNAARHTPVATAYMPTIVVLLLVGLTGYVILSCVPLEKLPPLWIVLSISALYIGLGINGLWTIQVVQLSVDVNDFLLLLPLFNAIMITVRILHRIIREWSCLERRASSTKPAMERLNRRLLTAALWPFQAFLLMWPVLGILFCILTLFGQGPDAVIKAFTETSSWNLSRRVSPQNIYYDEHYLCTVAAGGHRKIVKPRRLGIRHGHEVIVNRQLCIANAFEQILEEHTPGLHRCIRQVYDTYGFPVARLIHSPYIADGIYFLMKPLEWFFLLVLYLTDVHPEDRIALQYTGKNVSEFVK